MASEGLRQSTIIREDHAKRQRKACALGFSLSLSPSMEPAEYTRLAAVEDSTWYFLALHGHVWRELSRRLDAQATLLDAGCGTGGLIRRLGRRRVSWKWTGVDFSPLALELARERCGATADLREGSVTELPFEDCAFDAVVSADVLYHVDDDLAALHEFHRVLRPEGVLVVNVPAYHWLWSYHDEAVHGRRRYSRGELLEKVAQAGFVRGRATHWNMLPLPLIIARRKLFPPARPGSDVQKLSALVEAGLRGAMAIESGCLAGLGALPAGSSLLAVADKAADLRSDQIETRVPALE
jgi:SAM-dependent methyltransferase